MNRDLRHAEATLNAISFGVIRLDASGRVTFLNRAAEELTGWPLSASAGVPIERVFTIVDERSNKSAPNPATACMAEGGVVEMTGQVLLVSRAGAICAIHGSASPIRDRSDHIAGAVLAFYDASESRRLAQRLEHEATHDPLTGLCNRREFERRLENAVRAARDNDARHVLCYFDLDQFKLVNDTAGHDAGDALLKSVKGLLAGRLSEDDTFARLGGDEFGLLLAQTSLEQGIEVGRDMIAAFAGKRFEWRGRTFKTSASAGIVAITSRTTTAAQALAQADVSCYAAKDNGRNRIHVYTGSGVNPSRQHDQLIRVSGLHNALRENRFSLYGQPIVDLGQRSHKVVQFEVLLRLNEGGATIAPRHFIRPAERFGLMAAIDRWVIDAAFRYFRNPGRKFADADMTINISANSLNDDGLVAFLRNRVSRLEIAPQRVCLEITETATVENIGRTAQLLAEIKALGFALALDDFGSGLASFNYLKHMPIDFLKIDGGFVREMADSPLDLHMVGAINEVGHTLGLKTVAEYVESRAALECLVDLGVDLAQGFAVGHPEPLVAGNGSCSVAAHGHAAQHRPAAGHGVAERMWQTVDDV